MVPIIQIDCQPIVTRDNSPYRQLQKKLGNDRTDHGDIQKCPSPVAKTKKTDIERGENIK
jgi:hypothetical protein